MTTPSNETILEMIKGIKEEQLPHMERSNNEKLDTMRRESSNGLQAIHEKLNINSQRLELHEGRIVSLEKYDAVALGAISIWKWIAGVFATVIAILISILGLKN